MSKGNDWFLVAPDFTDYLRAQARPASFCWLMPTPPQAGGRRERSRGCKSSELADKAMKLLNSAARP